MVTIGHKVFQLEEFCSSLFHIIFNLNENISLLDTLLTTKICNSKREARELINGNSISINGEKVNKEDLLLKKENALYGKFIILKKGKKNYYLINLE